MSNGSRRSGACLRCCLVAFAVASALYVSGPALYWRFKRGFRENASSSPSSCTPARPASAIALPCYPSRRLHPEIGPCELLNGCVNCEVWIYEPKNLRHYSFSMCLINLSVPDCGKHDPLLNEEMEKQFVDLLTEELKLQEAVAEEHNHHMNYTVVEARRLASQYQKEAEKCNTATETSEEARERAEASLRREKKLTSRWEHRARQLGWQGE
ncbi:hypothetical protein Taro_030232 [Colocasia esculenta]|uniref:Uncharacterized protein n=1 Tax=Colocasia esculenta TaxID=4460 RepID=A0A843VVL1_COLES|nr:hypothetical protein [Colocasia esculenta]